LGTALPSVYQNSEYCWWELRADIFHLLQQAPISNSGLSDASDKTLSSREQHIHSVAPDILYLICRKLLELTLNFVVIEAQMLQGTAAAYQQLRSVFALHDVPTLMKL